MAVFYSKDSTAINGSNVSIDNLKKELLKNGTIRYYVYDNNNLANVFTGYLNSSDQFINNSTGEAVLLLDDLSNVNVLDGEAYLYRDIDDTDNISEQAVSKENTYKYTIGINDISFYNAYSGADCCRITKSLNAGYNNEITVRLNANIPHNAGIELSVLADQTEYPLMPEGTDSITNERIFKGVSTRFLLDKSKPFEIRRNGVLVSDMTFEEAQRQTDGIYSISYYPKEVIDKFIVSHVNMNIKLKYVLRNYNASLTPPYIKESIIEIHNWGGALWTDNI